VASWRGSVAKCYIVGDEHKVEGGIDDAYELTSLDAGPIQIRRIPDRGHELDEGLEDVRPLRERRRWWLEAAWHS
jgi:hypothetical protein